MNLSNATRETEMSKALNDLDGNIAILYDRIAILKGRLECVSIDKPCMAEEKPNKDNAPLLIQRINDSTSKLIDSINMVNYMLESLEI